MLDFILEQDPREYKPVDYPKLVEKVHEPTQTVSKKKKVKKGKLLLSTSLPIHTNTKTKREWKELLLYIHFFIKYTRKLTRLRRRIELQVKLFLLNLYVVGSLPCIFKSKVTADRTSS